MFNIDKIFELLFVVGWSNDDFGIVSSSQLIAKVLAGVDYKLPAYRFKPYIYIIFYSSIKTVYIHETNGKRKCNKLRYLIYINKFTKSGT